MRQVVFTQGQRNAATLGDFNGITDRAGDVGEQLRHFFASTQILLRAITFRAFGVSQHVAVADAHPCFVGGKIGFRHKPHVIGRHHRNVVGKREIDGGVNVVFLTFTSGTLQFQIVTIGEGFQPFLQAFIGEFLIAGKQCLAYVTVASAGEHDHALAELLDPSPLHTRHTQHLPLLVSAGYQFGEVAIANIVLAQQNRVE